MTIALYQALCSIGIKEQDAEAVVQAFDHTIDQRIQQQLCQGKAKQSSEPKPKKTTSRSMEHSVQETVCPSLDVDQQQPPETQELQSTSALNYNNMPKHVLAMAIMFLMAFLGIVIPLALWSGLTWYFFTREWVIGVLSCH